MSDPRSSLIDQIQAAEARATPGPWFSYLSTETAPGSATIQNAAGWLFLESDKGTKADADLLCLLRNHVPEILEALKFYEDSHTSKKAQREAPPHESNR